MDTSAQILEALNGMGTIEFSTMQSAFENNDDAQIMYKRYCDEYKHNNLEFYNHLCDIDRWKFNRFIKLIIA